jgi:DNA-binding Xre family transcriptional regulator
MAGGSVSEKAAPVAHAIFRRMTLLRMNKKQLATYSGLGETYVHDLFRGKSKNPRTEHLAKLAAALNCTVEDLTNATLPDSETLSEGADLASVLPLFPDDIALVRMWRILKKPAKDEVLMKISELLPKSPRS